MKSGEGNPKSLKISVPHFNNSALIKGYDKTLIGRCMNPAEQDVKALIIILPKIWKVEDHRGIIPQFFLWVSALDVPLEFWAPPTFESICDAIGKTIEVYSDNGRLKVEVSSFKSLVFETLVNFDVGEFHDGEEALVSLQYEKLFWLLKYQGKGKVKMYEEVKSNWVKVKRERGSRRFYPSRGNHRGDEVGYIGDEKSSHYRSSCQDLAGTYTHEYRTRASRGSRRGRSPRNFSVLDLVNEMIKVGTDGLEEDAMELDDLKANIVDKEGNDISREREEKCPVTLDVVKKHGARKVLFNNQTMAGGTMKKRLVQGFVSPRKRTSAKVGIRQGEGVTKIEEKGSSNPLPSSSKP
ncbi:hypothetical protein N665_0196s0021 [Sinapis alba]|nr:hypothetical protein N665_0196s0021 [Sinapis alba]